MFYCRKTVVAHCWSDSVCQCFSMVDRRWSTDNLWRLLLHLCNIHHAADSCVTASLEPKKDRTATLTCQHIDVSIPTRTRDLGVSCHCKHAWRSPSPAGCRSLTPVNRDGHCTGSAMFVHGDPVLVVSRTRLKPFTMGLTDLFLWSCLELGFATVFHLLLAYWVYVLYDYLLLYGAAAFPLLWGMGWGIVRIGA